MGGAKQRTPEEIYSQIASDVAQRLPGKFDVEAVIRQYPVLYEQCLNTVLHMELGKFNKLLRGIKATCDDLIKAVKGLVVFSPELEAVSLGCLQNKVPGPWISVSYPSLKPMTSYVEDFLERMAFMKSWVSGGIPYSFWFSSYFFQQAFLTGISQNFARKEKIAIDQCTWNYDVMKMKFKPDAHPERGAYTYGLFMDGARWDDENGVLDDSFPKVLWSSIPIIWLKPVELSESTIDPAQMYFCPVYKCSDRKGVLSTSGHSNNYILDITMLHRPEHSERFWRLRGCAMISQTDD